MIENKLKFMLENNKLDGLINNKSEAEKLCKLGTTEEVLDLLNKYNYNETKEVFERELLEILQDINLTEEELNKVTGGKISHRRKIAKFLGVVSLAGSINMPTTTAGRAAPVSAVAKKKEKSSGWLSHPTENRVAKASAAMIGTSCLLGLGSLLFYGGKKLLGSSDADSTQIAENKTTKQHTPVIEEQTAHKKLHADTQELPAIIDSLITGQSQLSKINIGTINQEDLENYAIREFESWCEKMHGSYYHDYERSTTRFADPKAWNEHFDTLLKIRWAIWLLSVQLGLLTSEKLATFTKGRYIDEPKDLTETARREEHQSEIKIPGDSNVTSKPLQAFWSRQDYTDEISSICCSLLEIPLHLDGQEKRSSKPVLEITSLSKKYFGEHYSPTDRFWDTKSSTEDKNLNEIIQDETDREHNETESEGRESSALDDLEFQRDTKVTSTKEGIAVGNVAGNSPTPGSEQSDNGEFAEIHHNTTDQENSAENTGETEPALAELSSLKAPNEKWDANLEKVDSIVVTLIQTPVQNYTDLVKNISADNLKTYAKQGLQLWCDNTKDHYEERLRSITNAEAWNANFGLLVKVRWAVWLLLIKEEKVKPADLQSCVKTRHFAGGTFPDIDKNLECWYEDTDLEVPLTTLTNPTNKCYFLRPWIGDNIGNVVFVIWSLTDDLSLESPQNNYDELRTAMEKIATNALPSYMYYIQQD